MTAYRINNQGPAGAAGSSFLSWAATGYSTTGQANVDRFFLNWSPYSTLTALEQYIVVPRSGLLKNMYVRADTSYAAATMTITIRVNGSNTAIVCVLAPGVSSQTNFGNVQLINAGDLVSCKGVQTVGDATVMNFNITLECAPA